jgi:hypothetical protein
MTMSTATQSRQRRIKWIGVLAIAALTGLAVLVGASALTGNGLHLKTFVRSVPGMLKVLGNQAETGHTGDLRNVVFLHHSVGKNLIEQGGVREILSEAGYRFWDHDYNGLGLRDPQGNYTGYGYNIPYDNTDPDGLLRLFSQPAYGAPVNALSSLLQHEVIAFKSCYPASDIVTEAQLAERKAWYLTMRDAMDQHPDKLFIVITQPALNPAETNLEIAVRARAFANWLTSDEFLQGRQNIAVFDLFDRLAESNPQAADANMLRQDFRQGSDSHPTQAANEIVGPQFAAFIIDAAEHFQQTRP